MTNPSPDRPDRPDRPDLVVRPAREEDVDAVAALELTCLGRDAWSAALVGAAVAGELPTVTALVAEVDGVVVGHAVLSVVDDTAELQRIAVAAQHRRRGVAAGLLDVVDRLARDGGADRVLLEVRVDNEAATALYRDRGFADLGRRERYYRDGAPALVLARPLGMMTP